MSIRFLCTACGKRLKAGDDQAGTRVKCSGCGTIQQVPGTPQPARPEEVEAPLTFGHKSHDDEELIDMTAMVDVTFFLLIFFMVTSLQSIQASIPMPTPDPQQEGFAANQKTQEVVGDDVDIDVRIDSENTIFVDGAVASTRQELLFKLREAQASLSGSGQASMTVTASGEARHETVVMALDAGTTAGLENIRLATGEGDEE